MVCFKSSNFNEIFVVAKLSKHEENEYKNKCNKGLLKQFYIANIEYRNNNITKKINYDIERIFCGTTILNEKYSIKKE